MHAVDKTPARREPVYVIFCSKAGEPTLKSLQYPSRHIVLISDSLTGRARAALQALPLKTATAATAATATAVATATAAATAATATAAATAATATAAATISTATAATAATAAAVAATTPMAAAATAADSTSNSFSQAFSRPPLSSPAASSSSSTASAAHVGAPLSNGAVIGSLHSLKDVLVEAFVSSYFMFDLLKQRYLRVVEFSAVTPKELDTVFDVFERKKDLGHFPRMLDTDPVVRHLRLPIGSVIKQTRLSTASAVHQSYRVIVRTSTLDKQ
jgi:DNA-directed RNA polymerase subunit H (RpoH/RPB5)